MRGVALTAFAVGLWTAERRWPLRVPTQPKLRRTLRNLAVAGSAGAVLAFLESPAITPVARHVERRRWGLLKRLPLPRPVEVALGVALTDYTLYLWHVLLHRSPWLWRMHLPHHADLDLDASTALRFHVAELAASVPWRAAQVALIGLDRRSYAAWQTFTVACILFHHSNLRLPRRLERAVGLVFATPRMHGIHHSTVRDETDSNWSSGLSVWDRLHGTLRLDVPQEAIEIGVPAFREPELKLVDVLALPFRRQPPAWRDPSGRRVRRGERHELMKEAA